MPRRTPAKCTFDGCPNDAARGNRCWTHLKRAKRGSPLDREVRGYRMSKAEKLGKAIARYASAESQQDFDRASALLEKYSSGGGRKRVAAIVRQTVDEVLRQLGKQRR